MEKYWKKMVIFRYRYLVAEKYLYQLIGVDRFIKILLAALSSSVVAAWALWKEAPIVWAAITAFCQVSSIIYDQLPYKKRISDCEQLTNRLKEIYSRMEKNWINVQEMSEKEAAESVFQYIDEWQEAESAFNIGDNPMASKRISQSANEENRHYFEEEFS